MSFDELIIELHKLNRIEKLKAIQILANDLVDEETAFIDPDVQYEVFTPYGNEEAAEILFKSLTS